MSRASKSDRGYEELLEIGTRCRELRKEKESLRESQSQGFDLIRSLDAHVNSLSEDRVEDKKRIQKLERELMNCYQEIDYLQDQLNARDAEVNDMDERVHNLELKLVDMELLEETAGNLREELERSETERLLLMEELGYKEVELRNSILCIQKLEESISSAALESQCEIESMKFDILALEQSVSEAKKIQEEAVKENAKKTGLLEELDIRFQEAQKKIIILQKENKELRRNLDKSEIKARAFGYKIEEWLENKGKSQVDGQSSFSEVESNCISTREFCTCGEVLGPLLSNLAMELASDEDLNEKSKYLPHQTHEYELLLKQLKEELREEKLKAKEESEDLAQEMAELRYQMTCLLEEERKRRACIEQVSLHRIAELEAQIQKEKTKSYSAVRHLQEAKSPVD